MSKNMVLDIYKLINNDNNSKNKNTEMNTN